jgi:predicted GNAT family acetyltransferase
MAPMKIFGKGQDPQQVTIGRFEIEQDGEVAYLEYSLSKDVLALIHTEVPPKLRHRGLAHRLAETALRWAREHEVKVDVICPFVQEYLDQHPEYADLVMK